eukprot:SAG31_NODE_1341_length_8708_cov_10.945174_9_plen_318_part_00
MGPLCQRVDDAGGQRGPCRVVASLHGMMLSLLVAQPTVVVAAVVCPVTGNGVPACGHTPKVGVLCATDASVLHPTQAELGMLLVQCKQRKFQAKSASKLQKYLLEHQIPAVIGPNASLYLTDHHHLVAALLRVNGALQNDQPQHGEKPNSKVYVCPTDDFSAAASTDDFWERMNETSNVYPYSAKGHLLRRFNEIPSNVGAISADDPFRSLSGWVRDSQAYIKCSSKTATSSACAGRTTNPPFLEFRWAAVLATVLEPKIGPSIYDTPVKQQVSKLASVLMNATRIVGREVYNDLPGYNHGDVPIKLVKLDKHGCEL